MATRYWGSIPAHAGKPLVRVSAVLMLKVYPRPCGETALALYPKKATPGLSPPMRGNLNSIPCRYISMGSIPAHAGKPRLRAQGSGLSRVYPRPCGETESCLEVICGPEGLSPPMRGNPLHADRGAGRPGSIPAHAGKPSRSGPASASRRVYPRPCGETGTVASLNSTVQGLSPPMRGNLLITVADIPGPGSIPAHAGKPI